MKKLLLTILMCVLPLTGSSFNELDKKLHSYYQENSIKGNPAKVDNYTWLKRTYLSLAGRIPTLIEIAEFEKLPDSLKKPKTIDKILYSEDFVNNFYNFWADMLRIRPERLSDDVALLKSYPYIETVRTFIRNGESYKDFVTRLLTATGKFSDNGATGYMLRDNGMPLDNLATTLQLFTATDISCAQCHDDPFQDYTQKQFYEMAAFFSPLTNRESRQDYASIIKRVDGEIKAITKADRIDNNVRQLLASNLFNLKDDENKTTKLPHDYKYPDGKPGDVVTPVSLDKKLTNVTSDRRKTATNWIVEHDNFSSAISNRIWEFLVGTPLIISTTNFNPDDYKEGKILQYLGDYLKTHNYNLKDLFRHICESDFYGRVAYSGNSTVYRNQSVLVQRVNSYKLWDSLLTLVIPDSNYSRIVYSNYADLIEIDWEKVNGDSLLKQMETIREFDRNIGANTLKYKNVDLVRACFSTNRNNFLGQFLREFGSSDRILIDSSDNNSSITQVLTMMNSPIVDLLTSKESLLMKDNNEQIFKAIMSRPMTINEKSILGNLESKDLIWVLINSREFLFKK